MSPGVTDWGLSIHLKSLSPWESLLGDTGSLDSPRKFSLPDEAAWGQVEAAVAWDPNGERAGSRDVHFQPGNGGVGDLVVKRVCFLERAPSLVLGRASVNK